MEGKQKQIKTPISHEKIYKIMLWVTFIVAGAFFIKNVVSANVHGMVVIGACLAVFGGSAYYMYVKKVRVETKQMVLAVSLLFLIFMISINSGESYSDDFPLFLAVVGMTGLYLEPKITIIQIVVADILLILMYILHPEKAGETSQYIMCVVMFMVAASLFYQTIKRGRAFIEIGEERAKEAERLVASMKEMGINLERDFAQSSSRIDNNTQELQHGSDSIAKSAGEMTESCNDVQDKIHISEQSITQLNDEVSKFEEALSENRSNVDMMDRQLSSVSNTIYEANEVFQVVEKKMSEVADIAAQLNNISFNTTILSLNASIEAARAGSAGAGFDVVATEMRDLSNNSNMFSEQVSEVVKEILGQVEKTAAQFMDSTQALKESETAMYELQRSFSRLMERFDALYGNIEIQNSSVNQVNAIFHDLKTRVMEMEQYSVDNQEAVSAIIDAMELYRVNIHHVIEKTRQNETE
ncbi:MAG: hypothetical protein J6A92_06975 [Lachnospiraceae bacterium]|nr:hypothetical protein [Lachnospiraceae bacterium]